MGHTSVRSTTRRVLSGLAVAVLGSAGVAASCSETPELSAVFDTSPTPSAEPGRPSGTWLNAAVPTGPPPARSRRTGTGAVVSGRRQPLPVAVPAAASGRYAVVPGAAKPPRGSRGTVVRYLVEVERGLPFRAAEFAAAVHRILNDRRSWGSGGTMRFERTDHGPARIRVSLSSPALADRQCLPLDTGGKLSCWNDTRAVINARRWGRGATTYGRDLASYREYVINHEVGHGLGHHHESCPGRGRPAPVMAQQTKSLNGCRRNPWPHRRLST